MQTNWHLSEKDFFYGLAAEREEFISRAVKHTFKKDHHIFFEGDPGDSAFYVEWGEVRVYRISPMGKESIYFIRLPGEMFGLAEVIGMQSRACNAQSITCCSLYEIKKAELEHLLSRHFSLSKRVMETMGRRLRYLGEQIENLMVYDVPTRVLKLFIYLGHHKLNDPNTSGLPMSVPIRLTQQQIAEMIGSCQQTVCVALKRLEKQEYIRISGKEITLLKPKEAMENIFEQAL